MANGRLIVGIGNIVGCGSVRGNSGNDWYGVRHLVDNGNPSFVPSATLERIGNPAKHAELPVQSGMRRCLLLDNGTVNYYLHPENSALKEDGTAAVLDGTDGQVMVEIPAHWRYWRTYTEDGNTYNEYLVSSGKETHPGYSSEHVPVRYVSAFEAALYRPTNTLSSVVNDTADYRGGNNSTSYDYTAQSQDGGFSLTGKPATSISLTDFRAYARKRGDGWNCCDYNIYEDLCWLYYIEYASTNIQLAYDSSLTAEGYRQGGLGAGVTNLASGSWVSMCGTNPFVPCGHTLALGNGSGYIPLTVPFSYTSGGKAKYGGEYDAMSQCTQGMFYSDGDDLYKCIRTNTGEPLSNTSFYTKQTRLVTNVPSYRGVENLFGHIWKHTDGILSYIHANSDTDPVSDVFVCKDWRQYASAVNNGYSIVGQEARSSGWTKRVIFPNMVCMSLGASATSGFCDYHNTSVPSIGVAVRCVIFGGTADYGPNAGPAYSYSIIAPSLANTTNVGSRLCHTPV